MKYIMPAFLFLLLLNAKMPLVNACMKAMAVALPALVAFKLTRPQRLEVFWRFLPCMLPFALWLLVIGFININFIFDNFTASYTVIVPTLSIMILVPPDDSHEVDEHLYNLLLMLGLCGLIYAVDYATGAFGGGRIRGSGGMMRFYSIFKNPNSSGFLGMILVSLALWHILLNHAMNQRILYGFLGFLGLIMMYLSDSRGAFVPFGIFWVLYGLLGFVHARDRVRSSLLALMVVAVIVLTAIYINDTYQVYERLAERGSSGRMEAWENAIEVSRRNGWLIGEGFGMDARIFRRHELFMIEQGRDVGAHSSYMALLMETGAIGLGLALLAIFWPMILVFQGSFLVPRERLPQINLVLGICAAMTIRSVAEATHLRYSFGHILFYYLITLGMSIILPQERFGSMLTAQSDHRLRDGGERPTLAYR